MPSTHRTRSSTPIASTSRFATQISNLASSSDIPTNNELSTLARILRDRKRVLTRKLESVQNDEQSIVENAGHGKKAENVIKRSTTLTETLENIEISSLRRSRSRSPLNSTRKDRPAPLNLHTNAKHGRNALSPSSSSPLQSNFAVNGESQLPRIKVKRESDRDRERSLGEHSGISGSGSHGISGTNAEGSPGVDIDWDEEGPSRPGRAFFNKRKRHRGNAADRDGSGDDLSQSEFESPAPTSTSRIQGGGQDDSSWSRRESMFSSANASTSTHKLKLNPTAQTGLYKRDSMTGGMLRRPSGIRGDDFAHLPLTPFQIQQAAIWELPKRTPETFIPKVAPRRQIRPYPIKPDDVDVDFSSMDWRERDKERDRLEAAAAAAVAASTPTGPGPGQAVVKESAVSRARDRKQDQVPFHTFQQWCDGWFRTLTEEDLAWLSSKSEDMDMFTVPILGKYYRDVWDEEESNGAPIPTVYLPNAPYSTTPLTPAFPSGSGIGPTSNSLSNGIANVNGFNHLTKPPKFDPRQLKDDHLFAGSLDEVRGGPFTERLLSVLLPTPPPSEGTDDGINQQNPQQAQQQQPGSGGLVLISGGHGGGNAGASQDMADYEDRLLRELKAIDVIGPEEQIDWSERTDDEISSTLRKVQKLLRKQIRINELRKSRLFEIAMDRMAYQDYVACLTSVEREIEAGWLRRQTQIKKSMQAQKKKKGGGGSSSSSGAAVVAAAAIGDTANHSNAANSPAAAGTPGAAGSSAMAAQNSTSGFVAENRGGGPIKPQFSEQLISAMQKRRQLLYAFEPMFAEKPLAKLTPKGDDSIYADLDLS